jgi:hypothetical protein
MQIPRIGTFDTEYGRRDGKLMLPQSLWTDTRQESVDTTPLSDNTESDVTIVGGGITGLSAAIHLREQGYAVTVLEAGEIGWGGSGRNGGHFNTGWKVDPQDILNHHGKQRGERIVRMADKTCDLVYELIERHNI